MTKDVIISIKGLQFTEEENEEVEIVTRGTYYFKNNRHYLLYDELMEGHAAPIKNTTVFDNTKLEVIKRGSINTRMIFEERKKSITCYEMPFGSLMIATNTGRVEVTEKEDEITARIRYALDVNYVFVGECEIVIKVNAIK